MDEKELLEKLHNNVFHIGKTINTIKTYVAVFFWVWIIGQILNLIITLLN